ncbi:MAG TPA: hypothetical protein VNH40_12565, partial [Gaiellaceae bacterium]|nr:hypothetical protein [Gaiellaceae bacterium]
ANAQSLRAFHEAVLVCAVLVAAGGIAGAIGIVNPRRTVDAEHCSGGQLVGVPQPAVQHALPNDARIPEPLPQEV